MNRLLGLRERGPEPQLLLARSLDHPGLGTWIEEADNQGIGPGVLNEAAQIAVALFAWRVFHSPKPRNFSGTRDKGLSKEVCCSRRISDSSPGPIRTLPAPRIGQQAARSHKPPNARLGRSGPEEKLLARSCLPSPAFYGAVPMFSHAS